MIPELGSSQLEQNEVVNERLNSPKSTVYCRSASLLTPAETAARQIEQPTSVRDHSLIHAAYRPSSLFA